MPIDDEIKEIRKLLEWRSLNQNEKNRAIILIENFHTLKKSVENELPDSGIRLWIAAISASICSSLFASFANDTEQLSLLAGIGNLLGHYIGKEAGQRYYPSILDSIPGDIKRHIDDELPVAIILECLEKLNHNLFRRYNMQDNDHFKIYLAATITKFITKSVFGALLSCVWVLLSDISQSQWPCSVSQAVQIFKDDMSEKAKDYEKSQDSAAHRRYPRI